MAKPLNCFIATIQTPQGISLRIVDEKTFTIGRSLEATLAFSDPNISRVHIIVYFKHERMWIEDQKSANGTFVNGEKILPEKMTPIEPTDVIKLGTSQIQIKLDVIEKAFRKDELKNPILPKEDRESLMALINGAHSEAQRLVLLAQEYQEKVTKNADAKAQSIETSMLARQEETLSNAKDQARVILQQAEEQAKQNYARLSEELTEQAHEEKKELIFKLEQESRQRLDEAIAECERKNSEIERQIQIWTEEAQQRNSEFELKFQEQVQSETEQKAAEVLKEIQQQALAEKEIILQAGRLEVEQEKESTRLELLSSKEEISVLKKEIVEQQKLIQQRREISEQEIEFRKQQAEAEIIKFQDEKKKEIQVLAEQRSREADLERQRKLEEVELQIQSRRLEFEKSKQRYEAEIEDLTKKKASQEQHNISLASERKRLEEESRTIAKTLTDTKSELMQNVTALEKTKNQYNQMQRELSDFNSSKSIRHNEIKDLENRQGQLGIQMEALIEKTAQIKKDYEAQTAAYKTKLTNEYEKFRRDQESQLDQLKLVEMSEVKKIRDRMIEDLFKEKDSIAKNILSSLEKKMSGKVDPHFWNAEFNNLSQTVLTCLEEKTTTLSTEAQSLDSKKTSLQQKQSREKTKWMTMGAAAALALLFIGQAGYEQFQKYQDPMKSAALEDAQARAADLEKRKFNPPQDDELRETYADSVIYTSNFVQNYLDEKFQHEWLKAASDYLLKQWRIEEEKTISILSAVNTMIKSLDEKKQAIHPDFIQEGLKKMNDLEAESTAKIKDMLGSQVKLEAFRRFEKRFYLSHAMARVPANSDTQSNTKESVETEKSVPSENEDKSSETNTGSGSESENQ
jgi:pSer/pThr/pTyr-binding forkhead associated (FHA) protein